MSINEPTQEELRLRAANGVDSYKTGYRHGLAESEQELGLARLTIEQLKQRISNQDEHIALLEATVLRIGATVEEEITDENALGYRPPCCDHGKSDKCCNYNEGECAADAELRAMGRSK